MSDQLKVAREYMSLGNFDHAAVHVGLEIALQLKRIADRLDADADYQAQSREALKGWMAKQGNITDPPATEYRGL